jgi:hypothetical protein
VFGIGKAETRLRIHKTLKMTPAMAAGVSQTLWSMDDLCEKMDAVAPKPCKRGPYKNNRSDIPALAARSSGEERQSYVLEASGRDGAGPPPNFKLRHYRSM